MDALQLCTHDGVSEVSHLPSSEVLTKEEAEGRRAPGVLWRSGRECGLGVHMSVCTVYIYAVVRVKDALFKERRKTRGRRAG